jgi:murein DD-endopeptidase MepM/ murein hydrolase activator NlpD
MSVRLKRPRATLLIVATIVFALSSAELVARASGPRPLGAGELVWWDEFRQGKLVELMKLIAVDGPIRLGGGELAPGFKTPEPVPASSQHLGFIWPVGSGAEITSRFGYRRDPLNPRVAQFHHGLDIRCSIGETIRSAHHGVVAGSGFSAVYGNWVIVDHDYSFRTFYGHLSSVTAPKGTRVARGDPIARCGATGRVTGAHLHFSVRHTQGVFDPLAFLPR